LGYFEQMVDVGFAGFAFSFLVGMFFGGEVGGGEDSV
jgi:hypothetical protein